MATTRKTIQSDQMAQYAAAGLTLIPLHRWDYVDPRGRQRGKSPRDVDWTRRPYDGAEVVEEAVAGGTNVGVRLRADWVVLDVDPRNFPAEDPAVDVRLHPEAKRRDMLFELNMELDLELATAPHVVTGSGGHHYYYRKPADVDLLDSLPDWQGIEFKSRGRQVVAAGSVHPCGEHYRWAEGSPALADARPLPRTLLLLARRQQATAGTRGAGEMSLDQLVEALDQLPVEEFREHDRWRDLMMSCHHATAGEGRQEFIDWSTGDPAYADGAWLVGRRWDSLHHEGTVGTGGRPITARFLYQQVLVRGGHVPIDPPEVDFEPIETDEELDGASVGDPTPEAERRSHLEEMNAKYCVVDDGGKCRIFADKFDPVLERQYYTRHTKTDFLDLNSNRTVEVPQPDGETKVMRLGDWWFRQPLRRQYQGVIFDPERTHEGWLNLWTGWAVQPARGDWSLLRELIRETLCQGDDELDRYVLNWIAHMCQNPGRPAEVALVFRGAKGTGKGTLGRALAGLAGKHGLHISSPEHLTGRFNSHLRDCICLFADEAFWAGDKKGESVLKQLVTEPTVAYEAKGKDIEPGRNLIHVVVASNADWVVPAGMDRERRFCVAEVSENRVGDKGFFTALNRQLQEGGTAALLHDMIERDIGDWAPRDGVPQTRGLVDQKLRSMDLQTAWWHQKLTDGFLPNQRQPWDEGPATVLKEFLRRDFQQSAKDAGWGRAGHETEFGQKMSRLVPGIVARQVTALGDEYGVRTDVKGRAMAYELPPLDRCRGAFEEQIGGRLTWPRREED